MSETNKSPADAIKKAGASTVDASTRIAKEAIGQTSQAAHAAANTVRDAGQGMTETAAETTSAATGVAAKSADHGREIMLMGMRTAAGVGGRVADISYDRGHDMLASATHMMDIYHDASERSAARVQALMSSAMTLGRGMQQMQQAWLKILDHTLESATHKPQDLLRCKTLVEVAEVQRDLYLGAINHAFASSTRILDLAGRTAQEAARPLQTLAH